MTSTTFVDNDTSPGNRIVAAWLNDVNGVVYNILGNGTVVPASRATARVNLGVSGVIPCVTDAPYNASPSASAAANTAAFQAAIAANTCLKVPAGTFNINAAALVLPTGFTLVGAGQGSTILRAASAGDLLSLLTTANTAFVNIRDLTLDGNGVGTIGIRVEPQTAPFSASAFHCIERVTCQNFTSIGIYLYDAVYCTVRDCYLASNPYGIQIEGNDPAQGSGQHYINNCVFYDNTTLNLFVKASYNNTFDHNTLIYATAGLRPAHYYMAGGSHNRFVGGKIETVTPATTTDDIHFDNEYNVSGFTTSVSNSVEDTYFNSLAAVRTNSISVGTVNNNGTYKTLLRNNRFIKPTGTTLLIGQWGVDTIDQDNYEEASYTATGYTTISVTNASNNRFHRQGLLGNALYTYRGVVAAAGPAAGAIPAAWSWAKNSTGNYTITHNLGSADYVVNPAATSTTAKIATCITQAANSFTVLLESSLGVPADADWAFTLTQ